MIYFGNRKKVLGSDWSIVSKEGSGRRRGIGSCRVLYCGRVWNLFEYNGRLLKFFERESRVN